MNKKFKFIDLFCGIGGFRLPIEKFGGECIFSSEIDKYADKAYATLYGHKTSGDITKINEKDIPNHDVLVGGFPCQSFSLAGKRRGFSDTRGTMFFEIARIIHEKQPKLLLLENVKGLISHNGGQTLETMLEILSDEGYTIDFQVLNSKFYNVPQNRERIIIVGVLGKESERWNIKGKDMVAQSKKRLSNNENIKTFNFNYPTSNTVTKTIRDILEDDVDEKYYINEEKTKQLLEQLRSANENKRKPLTEKDLKQREVYLIDDQGRTTKQLQPLDICPTLRAQSHGNEPKIIEEGSIKMVGLLDMKGNETIRRVYDPDGISPTLTTMGGGHREPKVILMGNVNPSGRGMNGSVYGNNGLSPTLTTNKGEGTKIMVADYIEVRPCLTPDRIEKRQNGRRFKEDGEPSFSLTAQDVHGVAILSTKRPQDRTTPTVYEDICPALQASDYKEPKQVFDGYRIRKLTPLECFRLQGFPDEYCYKLKAAGISDTQLYKMVGNAVTTNMVEAVFSNLIELL